jgi:hypothetical protein
MPNPDLPIQKRLSWIVSIVPYVQADILYSKMDKVKGWDAEENRFAALLRLAYLRCPAYPERPPESTLAPTHYLGIPGVGPDAAALPPGDPRAGFFGHERKFTFADIKDRTSDILMVVETGRAHGS